MKRLTPRTLGSYLGADCKRKWILNFDDPDADEFKPLPIDGTDIDMNKNWQTTPILRPLESMTETEAKKVCDMLNKIYTSIQATILHLSPIWSVQCSFHDAVKIGAYLQSIGVDVGGEYEITITKKFHDAVKGPLEHSYTETKWTPSLIGEGLAIEKGKGK